MMTTYKQLLTQRELRNGISTGIDAEYITCHYLMARKDFKWALRWDDLRFPGDYRWQQIERGIDVVAEHNDGSIWAIQVKDYDKFVDYNAFTKMNAFVQSGERRGVKFDRMALVCTNKPAGRVLVEVCEENNTVIFDRTNLGRFRWPTLKDIKRDYKKYVRAADPKLVRRRLAVPENHPKRLWTHQKQCLRALRKHFKTGTRARVYMVTGAGKTVTFVRLAEDYDNVLVVVPRLLLAQQTYEKFMQQTRRQYDHILFVASSIPRYDNDDEEDLKPSDLTGTHTTDPDEIAAFMELPGRKLIISTYKSSDRVRKAGVEIDLAIFDEAHHVTGFNYSRDKRKQSQALLHSPGIKRRLFLTATPRVYTSDIKQGATEGGHYVASLDNVLTFGRLVYEFTYNQALNAPEPIVKPYEIHLVVLNDDEYRDALRGKHVKDAATKQNIASPHIVAALAQAKVVKAHKLHHGIGFANKIDNANRMRDYYLRFVGNHFAETLSSRRTVRDNQDALKQFKDASEGFITNVNILSEGMDAPCIDYVVFADPMQSKQAIAQKIGRGLRYDPAKPDAKLFVVVPIILEDVDNIDYGKFKTILEVLGAMSTMDKTLEVELNEIASNLPSAGFERRFKIDADIPAIDLQRLQRNISTAVFSPAPIGWWVRFAELESYVASHGRVPLEREGTLGVWVGTQRSRYKESGQRRSPFSPSEIEALETLGDGSVWSWAPHAWDEKLVALKTYVDTHGTFPSNTRSHDLSARALGRWLHVQRRKYAQGMLSYAKQQALEKATPNWRVLANAKVGSPEWWEKRIYCEGDIDITNYFDTSLYVQARKARAMYNANEMSEAEQHRCQTDYPQIWEWIIASPRYEPNKPNWWKHRIYTDGDNVPRVTVNPNEYGFFFRARKIYRDGKMSKAEQQRCRKNYPNIWEWLNK